MGWFDIGRIIGGGVLSFFNPAAGIPILTSGVAGLASDKASDTLQEGNQEATRIAREARDQTRADYAPFYAGGTQAFTTVGELMGLPVGGGAGGQRYQAPGSSGKMKPPGWTPEGQMSEGEAFDTWTGGQRKWGPTHGDASRLGDGRNAPAVTVGDLTRSGMGAPSTGSARPRRAMDEQVIMESPDGERQPVSAEMVPWLIREGAKVVG